MVLEADTQQPIVATVDDPLDGAGPRLIHKADRGFPGVNFPCQTTRKKMPGNIDKIGHADSGVSVTNLVDVSRHLFSCGLAWKIHSWEPAVSFVYETGSRTIQGVVYRRDDRLLSIGLQYHTL